MKSPLQHIIKRNGQEVDFEPQKIIVAITKAVDETNEFGLEEINRLTDIVINLTGSSFKPKEIPTVEQISDIIRNNFV